jgi:ribosomal protein S4
MVRPSAHQAVRLQRAKGETLARPDWLEGDSEMFSVRVALLPDEKAIPFPIEIALVVEFYS